MARRKKSFDDGGGNEWMNTYADLVTLLLCFFVLLFTMSSVEEAKWESLVSSFRKMYGDEVLIDKPNANIDPDDVIVDPSEMPDSFADLAAYFQEKVNENNFGGDVTIVGNGNVVFIRFNNSLLFDPNSSSLSSPAKTFLHVIGDAVHYVNDQIKMIRINGHTAMATLNGGTYITDRELSTQRANSVLLQLEDVETIDPEKLIAIGYGRNYPISDNDTEEGRSKNRRVEIIIMATNTENPDEKTIFDILSGEFDLSLYQNVLDENMIPIAPDQLPSNQ